MIGSPFCPGFWSFTEPVNSTSPLLFSPMVNFVWRARIENDEADEEAGHAVEIVLRPALERMIVAAGALQLRAEEDAADGDSRFLRLARNWT